MNILTKFLFSLVLSVIPLQHAAASVIVNEISGYTDTWSQASAGGVPDDNFDYVDYSYFSLPKSYTPPSVATSAYSGGSGNYASADADATQSFSATTSQFVSNGYAESNVARDGSYDYARATSESQFYYEFYLTETYAYNITGELTGGGAGSFENITLKNSDTLVTLFALNTTHAGTGAHNASGILTAGTYYLTASISSLAGDHTTLYPDTVTSGYFVQFDYEPATAVPVPAAIWLFGSGLMALLGTVQRKSARAMAN